MAIPIPSNLPHNPIVDFRQNDLLTPPNPPSVIENVQAVDPRVALKLALPVGNLAADVNLRDVTQALTNPVAEQAVLLEISSQQAQEPNGQASAFGQTALAQSLAKMDSLGSAALGQLLSDILQVDVPQLGDQIQTGSAKGSLNAENLQNVVVNWPANVSIQNAGADPRLAMANLYQSLQSSGIFAADQLKKLLFPSSEAGDVQTSSNSDLQTQASNLLSQLENNAPTVPDSVKLLLRGDLIWQGQLMPNVQGRIYREDAWQSDPKDPAQIVKGSKITMEVTLPHLGPFKVVGTQFGESVHVAIQASSDSQSVLSNAFSQLLEQMRAQVDPDAKVSMKGESSNT